MRKLELRVVFHNFRELLFGGFFVAAVFYVEPLSVAMSSFFLKIFVAL